MERRRFLKVLAAASVYPLSSSCAVGDTENPGESKEEEETQSLASAAQTNGRLFGSAVHSKMLRASDPGRQVTLLQCTSVTPEWSLKWDRLMPQPGSYDFGDADKIADFARSHGKRMRGHTLLWHLGMPNWANALLAETREWQHVRNFFGAVMPRYGDIVDEWDVINEPIDVGFREDGLRHNQFMQAFGPDYIDWAFWSAHEVQPHARLFLNDYGLEYALSDEGSRRVLLLRLIERLLSRGVPLHGVGLQAHLDLRKGKIYADGVYGLLRDVSDFGLQVSITELDVREDDGFKSIEERDTRVADEVRRYLDIVLDFTAVKSVTTWGLSDRDSWLTYSEGGRMDNRGLPYDRKWRRKQMRTAIAASLSHTQPSA